MMKPVLSVSHLGLRLDGETIFEDLSFELEEGETIAVIGPNGVGKSMLLRALLGRVRCIGQISWKKGVRIGYVPQRVPMMPGLPVTIEDFFRLKGATADDASWILSRVGLEDRGFMKRQLGSISSGQFQRVLIAWALFKDPEVLLFDEPVAGVDAEGQETIHRLIHRTERERRFSIILVTHELAEVYRDADRVLCLSRNAYEFGRPAEVLKKPRDHWHARA